LKEIYKCKGEYSISKVAAHATLDPAKLLLTLQEKSVVVKTYTNANFVNLTLEKRIYERFERLAELLGVKAETIIGNAIILILKELERTSLSLGPIAVENPEL
jgi:hypothetical protein